MPESPPPAPADAAQPVVSPLTSAAMFLILTVRAGGEDRVRDLIPDLTGLSRAVGFGHPESGLACVTGFGSRIWDRLFAGPRPAELHPFVALDGPRHRAPSTPGDLLFHIRAETLDVCFQLAGHLTERLGDAAALVDEVHGFRYLDRRDLLGFVDGTENPEGSEAVDAALVGPEREPDHPELVGGSYVVVQKYLHDLSAWNTLSDVEQAHAIGRTKADNVELSDAAKLPDSHVALNTITGADGVEQDILRVNMPFGSFREGEMGTYFIGYCATPTTTEQMLRNMFLGTDDAAHDRILDFSTAVTGGLFFVPPAGFLDDPPPSPGSIAASSVASASETEASAVGPAPAPTGAKDGSLGIGSLKRSTAS
jgi:putative iron-dependent peroxidase